MCFGGFGVFDLMVMVRVGESRPSQPDQRWEISQLVARMSSVVGIHPVAVARSMPFLVLLRPTVRKAGIAVINGTPWLLYFWMTGSGEECVWMQHSRRR